MEQQTRRATEVNPDAGHHLIASDPEVSAACEAAMAESFAEFPYWQARFGRAEAFTRSDSGWMVLAAGEGSDHCVEQVTWLARVLAARGMPRVLMEHHLEIMAAKLRRARPGDDAPEALRAAAAHLRQRRQAVIADDRVTQIVAGFDAATQAMVERGEGVANCGLLVVAAVCDEADVPDAVGSLVEWLGDPERFPEPWIKAVSDALDATYRELEASEESPSPDRRER